MITMGIAGVALAIWVYLIVGRGRFWNIAEEPVPESGGVAARIAIVVPARNEAELIGAAVRSLLGQEYAGKTHLFLVDDHSSDETAAIAVSAAEAIGAEDRFSLLLAEPLPPGWTGKLWAVSQGLRAAAEWEPDYVLLTDADIVHHSANLRELLARAEAGGYDLVSLMVLLRCASMAERALIPAFVFFFFMLYPPAWIADSRKRTAGAAGGCMLLRWPALLRIGGIESIRGELIDDCALAREAKRGGAVWLGVTRHTESVRSYGTFAEVWDLIARTAFHQLRYSPVLLGGTLLGLALTYLAPPVLVVGARGYSQGFGALAWILMSFAFWPVLRLYGRSVFWAPALPLIASFYAAATLGSAVQFWRGRGGMWKGRAQSISR